jgi:hypothetical protein
MKIDLKKLIENRALNRPSLAKVLYPKAQHPSIALTRLINGRSRLSEEQIYRLSIFTGLSVDALYQDALYWKQASQSGLVRFTCDNFSAVYSPQTGITKVYELDSLLATHILSKPNQPLSEYLSEINQIVINKSLKS